MKARGDNRNFQQFIWEMNAAKEKAEQQSYLAEDKAKKFERKRLKDGWRWIKLSARSAILVPCDKHGNPTEEGQKRIARYIEKYKI